MIPSLTPAGRKEIFDSYNKVLDLGENDGVSDAIIKENRRKVQGLIHKLGRKKDKNG